MVLNDASSVWWERLFLDMWTTGRWFIIWRQHDVFETGELEMWFIWPEVHVGIFYSSDSVCVEPAVFSVIEAYFPTFRAADETGNVLIGAEQKPSPSSSFITCNLEVSGCRVMREISADDVRGPRKWPKSSDSPVDVDQLMSDVIVSPSIVVCQRSEQVKRAGRLWAAVKRLKAGNHILKINQSISGMIIILIPKSIFSATFDKSGFCRKNSRDESDWWT